MSQPAAALVQSDLSSVRIVGEGAARWEVTPIAGAEVTPRSMRARADEAARWIASQPSVRRRLGVLVIDVNEAICAWLRTPSLAQPVLAATLRAHAQDWGDLMPVSAFEPLVNSQPTARGKRGKKNDGTLEDLDNGLALGVLCMPDATLRLWLDALDSMNVRIGNIMSLWHAMARVWPGDAGGGVTASVVIDDEKRLVWAWSQAGELVCGGAVTLLAPAEESQQPEGASGTDPAPTDDIDALAAAGKRLTLDWLTWSSHLGQVPERIHIVGMGTEKLAASLRERWGASRFETRSQTDPIGHTLQQLLGTMTETDETNPRRVLTRLSHRPTRSVRARYRLTAATLALSGVCLALVGQRLGAASKDMAAQEAAVRQQTREEARKEVPEIPVTGTAFELRQLLEAAANKPVESFKPPPSPRPIYEEFQRIAGILENYPDVKINGIAFDQEATGQCRLQIRAPDRRTATEIFESIKGSGKPIEWTRQQSGAGAAGAFDDLNLVGRWVD